MQISAPPDAERDELQRDCFFGQRCRYFRGAFTAVEVKLGSGDF
jgi:hypothetical protein